MSHSSKATQWRLALLVLLFISTSANAVLSPLGGLRTRDAVSSVFAKIDVGFHHWHQRPSDVGLSPVFIHLDEDTNEEEEECRTNPEEEALAQPVYDLLARLLGPTAAANFTITLQQQQQDGSSSAVPAECGTVQYDWGLIETPTAGKVSITANNVLAASWALGHYLKYHANLHVSWSGSHLYVPEQWPSVSAPYCMKKLDRLQYYQNVCTLSYSFVWWSWERWQRELDFMALNGINFALAFVGEEELFYRTFMELGVPEADVEQFFSGPAFLAWQRMGNIQQWGGPLPRTWRIEQLALQLKILKRMKELNIVPINPAFAGHVPPAMVTLFPDESFQQLSCWNKFNETYSCTYFLNANTKLYRTVTDKFISIMVDAYGAELTSHFYNIDPFNEMRPESGSPSALAETSKRIYQHLASADEHAVWVFQGWIFVHDPEFWTYDRARAFLTAVDVGNILVLDLQSDMTPEYGRLDSYFGQPYIWCMLNNYGGVSGLYGRIRNITHGPIDARRLSHSSMAGIGTTMEGIDQNDAMFEMVNEMSWRATPPDATDWFSRYAVRRYGLDFVCTEQKADLQQLLTKALLELADSVWNCTTVLYNHGQYEIVSRPSLSLQPIPFWYDANKVVRASELMRQAEQTCPALVQQQHRPYNTLLDDDDNDEPTNATFEYDLIDIERQLLQIEFTDQYARLMQNCIACRTADNRRCLLQTWHDMNATFDMMEAQLARVPGMRLNRWLRAARAQGASSDSEDLFEWNARNQLTLWGPDANILDYAGKQWNGLMSQYYRPRWDLFFATLLQDGSDFNQTAFNQAVFEQVELPFTMQRLPSAVNYY